MTDEDLISLANKTAIEIDEDPFAEFVSLSETAAPTPEIPSSQQADLQSLLAAFRLVGAPLMQAVAESAGGENTPTDNRLIPDTEQFAALIKAAMNLSRLLTPTGIGDDDNNTDGSAIAWKLFGTSSKVVAAYYKSTRRILTTAEAQDFAAMMETVHATFRARLPIEEEHLPNTVTIFRARMSEALVPVIGAVAQYSFGRAEHALLAEVAERLIGTADQVTRALAPSGATPEEWRMLCWNLLRSAGQIYTECHYAEADRLVYMDPTELNTYCAQHDGLIPMVQVWQAFNQRMAMLATLATYLEVPASAHLEKECWP